MDQLLIVAKGFDSSSFFSLFFFLSGKKLRLCFWNVCYEPMTFVSFAVIFITRNAFWVPKFQRMNWLRVCLDNNKRLT